MAVAAVVISRKPAAIVAAVANGMLSPEEGSAIGSTISLQHKALELAELERRIASSKKEMR